MGEKLFVLSSPFKTTVNPPKPLGLVKGCSKQCRRRCQREEKTTHFSSTNVLNQARIEGGGERGHVYLVAGQERGKTANSILHGRERRKVCHCHSTHSRTSYVLAGFNLLHSSSVSPIPHCSQALKDSLADQSLSTSAQKVKRKSERLWWLSGGGGGGGRMAMMKIKMGFSLLPPTKAGCR